MKAMTIDAPGRTSYIELPEPVCGSDEVLLRVRRLGFCGSDLNTFRGLNPLVSYPRVPGHEIAGEIISRGSLVPSEFAAGMIVTVLPYTACGKCTACRAGRHNACRNNQTLGVQRDGALAKLITVPWEKILIAPTLGETALALVEPLSVGFHAVERGRVTSRDTVLVLGCGMIGLGAIAAAGIDRGARVIAVDIDDAKLELAKSCGASVGLNSRNIDLPAAVNELTGNEGADVVMEAVGLPQTYAMAVQLAAFAGRIVYIGYAKEPVSYDTKYFVMKELDIVGSRNATREDFTRVVHLLESGRYPAADTITRTASFPEGAAALEEWSSNPAAVTKIHVVF